MNISQPLPESRLSLLIRGFINRALAEYGVNPAVPSILRGLAARAPDLFIQEAFLQLQSGAQSAGHRQLAVLLLRYSHAMGLLAHPTYLRLSDAVTIAKRLLEVDSLFDVRLARQLPGRDSPGSRLTDVASERVLDIINEVSRGGRIVPILGHLTGHPNPRIAAKATLVLGRRIHNLLWIKRHLASNDFRIRANTVEALWGNDSEAVVEAFEQNLSDLNNRVVGNAAVGLHLAKSGKTAEFVNRMLRNGSAPFRWTAAWVMGKTGKPEFVEQLHGMMRDDAPGVRGAALRALFHIRRIADEPLVVEGTTADAGAEILAGGWEEPPEDRAIGFNLQLDGTTFRALGRG